LLQHVSRSHGLLLGFALLDFKPVEPGRELLDLTP
jgi:hypothetical protein